MNSLNSTISSHQKGQHLALTDRVTIQIMHEQGQSLRQIARVLRCSPTTVKYELERGQVKHTTLLTMMPRRHKNATKQGTVIADVGLTCGPKAVLSPTSRNTFLVRVGRLIPVAVGLWPVAASPGMKRSARRRSTTMWPADFCELSPWACPRP